MKVEYSAGLSRVQAWKEQTSPLPPVPDVYLISRLTQCKSLPDGKGPEGNGNNFVNLALMPPQAPEMEEKTRQKKVASPHKCKWGRKQEGSLK